MSRVARLQRQLADARGGRVVLLSHCLLNQNVRYLGGAGRAGGVRELVDDYRRAGVEIVGFVGVGGSPSCGVRSTLDLPAAVNALCGLPCARLDLDPLNEGIIAANIGPGEGMFACARGSDRHRPPRRCRPAGG